jgi:hypothetical protein
VCSQSDENWWKLVKSNKNEKMTRMYEGSKANNNIIILSPSVHPISCVLLA